MSKYNLKSEEDNGRYFELSTIQDLIDVDEEWEEDIEELIKNCYQKIADYLGENDFKNIIAITDINGTENQHDFNDFISKFCSNKNEKNLLDTIWFYCEGCINEFGDKFVFMNTEGTNLYVFTKDFYNKYVNMKGEN